MSPLAVLIPTRDRHASLRRSLASPGLSELTHRLLICDQSQQPFPDPGPWRVLHRPDLPGLPAARNHLLTATDAAVVCFLDDDVDLPPGFGATLLRLASDEPGLAAWGPVVERRGRALRRLHRLAGLGALRDPRRLTAGPVDHPTRALFGCCFALRRAAALAIGGFDARLRGYALGEDLDFFLRLHAAGHRLRFSSALRCVHRADAAGRADRYRRGVAKARCLRRIARAHGRDDPATPLHLALALAAAAAGRGHEPADPRGVLTGCHGPLYAAPSREPRPLSGGARR
ncbi:MAG: glycosyltransferase family 2 protein [Planctomycetota bacterium]